MTAMNLTADLLPSSAPVRRDDDATLTPPRASLAGATRAELAETLRAHGVPGLMAHLDGAISLEEAIRRGQADTRAYAKRQVTWFRHQMTGWQSAAPEAALETALRELEG